RPKSMELARLWRYATQRRQTRRLRPGYPAAQGERVKRALLACAVIVVAFAVASAIAYARGSRTVVVRIVHVTMPHRWQIPRQVVLGTKHNDQQLEIHRVKLGPNSRRIPIRLGAGYCLGEKPKLAGVSVSETPKAVTITPYVKVKQVTFENLPPGEVQGCAGVGYNLYARATRRRTLGARRLLDGSTNPPEIQPRR